MRRASVDVAAMLIAALRDLQWRRRRFIIAIVGTGVVFAMTLVLTGLSNGFRVEAENTVDSLGIDSYLIKAGAAGPFLGASPFAGGGRPVVARMPGVMAAAPLVYAATTADDGGTHAECRMCSGRPTRDPGCPPSRRAARHRARTRSRCRAHSTVPWASDSRSIRAHCMSSASSTTPRRWRASPTCSSRPRARRNWCSPVSRWSSSIGIRGTPAAVPDGLPRCRPRRRGRRPAATVAVGVPGDHDSSRSCCGSSRR